MTDRKGQVWVGGMSPWVGVFLIVRSEPGWTCTNHRTVDLETLEMKLATETSSWDQINAGLDARGCLDGSPWWRLV